MRNIIFLLFTMCVFASCTDNPVDHSSRLGKIVVSCSAFDEPAAKPAAATVRADFTVSNFGAPTVGGNLTMSGKTASGTVAVKAGTGYLVDVNGYDSSNRITYHGSASNVTVEKGKTTAVSITLVKAGTAMVSISGVISGADGVTVTLSGDMTDSRAVNSGDQYIFSVPSEGNYTVTPTKEGYTFTPDTFTFTKPSTNQQQNFLGSKITFTLSGTVTGADSVVVALSGDAGSSQTVNSGGIYSFSVAYGGNFTVTPIKTGYVFVPASKSFTNVTSNQTQDFSVTKQNFTLSGIVTGADGVAVTISGDATATQTVNNGGSYSFTIAFGGTYTVTATKTGYVFAPLSKSFSNVTTNQTLNFTATKQTFTLSGKITGADGVTVTLSGDASATQTVNNGGTYSFSVAYGGNYTVTPRKTGYMFAPASKSFTNVTANQTQDFFTIPILIVSIPAGSFSMGSNVYISEQPMHTVTLSAFEMSIYEITQGQYKAVMGSNPAYFTGDDNLPVENNVTWWDAITYCNALSRKAGLPECYSESTGDCDFTKNGFRLPTEAEWEYACRAGTTTNYYSGDTESDLARAGWYVSNSSEKTHPVGQKTPNAWGLYDMHGNVWEWCNDWYGSYASVSATNPTGANKGSSRVMRGGGWDVNYWTSRSALRSLYSPDNGNNNLGFRVVRRP